MRRIIISTLFLSAALLNAQNSTKGQGAPLEARNLTPSTLPATEAAKPGVDASASTQGLRVSTGVISAKLVKFQPVELSASEFHTKDVAAQKLVLHFQVDESGTPQNIEVVKPVNPDVDARIVDAVRKYHYKPAQLDGQVVASDLNLIVSFATR
jgi:TonB family protein